MRERETGRGQPAGGAHQGAGQTKAHAVFSWFISLARQSKLETFVGRQYQSIMKDCQDQLSESFPTAQSGHYLAQSDLLYNLELIWHLLEILYLDTTGAW